jgi:hypothetical protein
MVEDTKIMCMGNIFLHKFEQWKQLHASRKCEFIGSKNFLNTEKSIFMIEVVNENYKEYKSILITTSIPIIVMLILSVMMISSIVNQQMSITLIEMLFVGYLLMLAFINYLVNLAHSRHYTFKIIDQSLWIERKEKKYEVPIRDVKKLLYSIQRDLTGSTDYLMIVTKGFKKNIYISNYKANKDDLINLIEHPIFEHIKVTKFSNRLIGEVVVFVYSTIFLTY